MKSRKAKPINPKHQANIITKTKKVRASGQKWADFLNAFFSKEEKIIDYKSGFYNRIIKMEMTS